MFGEKVLDKEVIENRLQHLVFLLHRGKQAILSKMNYELSRLSKSIWLPNCCGHRALFDGRLRPER